MANPTTAFGWVMPNSANLVTDLPADFNVFGQGVDTSMQYLLGGTTGQVLSKTSGTNMAFTWINNDTGDITGVTAGVGITGGGTSGTVTVTNDMATTITTNGDLIYGTGSGTYTRRGIGSTSQVLTVAGGVPTWATPASFSSGLAFISLTNYSAQLNVNINSVFTSTYTNYYIVMNSVSTSATQGDISFRLRASGTDTSANYQSQRIYGAATTVGAGSNVLGTDEIWFTSGSATANPPMGAAFTLMSPNVATRTTMIGSPAFNQGGSSIVLDMVSGTQSDSTQFDGITFNFSTNNSGSIYIYGLAKA